MRFLVTLLLVLGILGTGTDATQWLRRASPAGDRCCCASSGHACHCTGSCCSHGPRTAARAAASRVPDGRVRFDSGCGSRSLAPGAAPVVTFLLAARPHLAPPVAAFAPATPVRAARATRREPPREQPPRPAAA